MISSENHWEGLHEVLHAFVESRLPRRFRRHVGVSDIVQSVLYAAQANGHQFRGATRAEYRRWLLTIAENKIVDSMRRHRERACPPKLQNADFAMTPQATTDRTPDSQVALAEQSRMLLESIALLPQDVRRVIILRYTQELGFAEIAARLGMTESTVRRRWLEGLQLLGDSLR